VVIIDQFHKWIADGWGQESQINLSEMKCLRWLSSDVRL